MRNDSVINNKSYTYTYDDGGNLVSKSEYDYTTDTLGTATKTVGYGYDTTWADKLTSYDGNAITYDAIGNPLTYGDWEYTWTAGRQLATARNSEKLIEYTYNADGLRTDRKVYGINNGVVSTDYTGIRYTWDGSKLVSLLVYSDDENSAGYQANFIYNNNGEVMGYECNNVVFYYRKNFQGDITAVISSDNILQISYRYDAWGNVTTHARDNTVEGILSVVLTHIINPFTYRGYFYDAESNIYYLQSRYYIPEWGRFLNADSTQILISSQGAVFGADMFSYCENNPVNNVDPYGLASFLSLKSDWAGRELLKHYLRGGGKPFTKILDDKWSNYMMSNSKLKCQTKKIVEGLVKNLKPNQRMNIHNTTSMTIDNGEDIIGYQYLHGTNANVGGFYILGTVGKRKNGELWFDLEYTWNDIIDPNYKYDSDAIKAKIANHIPFCDPQDYVLKITWYDHSIYNPTTKKGSGWFYT